MFRGLMDHWVPTRPQVSSFWRSDLPTCCALLDDVLAEIACNNFTFYTKWYTNGVRSALPFLRNHPSASNTLTDNAWGRGLLEHLHSRGLTAGAMLQCYAFEQAPWGDAPTVGQWGDDVFSTAEIDAPLLLADFTSDLYQSRLAAMLREQLTLFPAFDYFFLEFEGIGPEMAELAYRRWCAGMGEKPVEEPAFSAEVTTWCEHTGIERDYRFSDQALEMYRACFARNLRTAQVVLDDLGYRGTPGVVYHPMYWEKFVVPETLPHADWWMLPWSYFGWVEKDDQKRRMAAMLAHLQEQVDRGAHVLYTGDATIAPYSLTPMEMTMDFCETSGAEGYLGMGNPTYPLGLHWLNVTEEMVASARAFFRRRWPT